jgi:hypothetical protein
MKVAAQTWRERHPDRYQRYLRIVRPIYRRTPKRALENRIRSGIHQSLEHGKQGCRWETLVGYTLSDLQDHLERQFQPGMTWENMGQWHIDHIIPISFFCYTAPQDVEFRMCWRLENLRPLWAIDNIKKGSTIPIVR